MISTETRLEAVPAVIAPECARGDCKDCRDSGDHPCEHNCHVLHRTLTFLAASAAAETKAIGQAYQALHKLNPAARQRALRWLSDRFSDDDHTGPDPWAREEPPF